MTDKKELLFEEHEKCELFKFLGIRHGAVMVNDVEIGVAWTRADLNILVGLAAVNHNIDIVNTGVGFIRQVGERFAPNMGAIANQIRLKKVSKDATTQGFTYKDGHFYNPFGVQSPKISCLAEAISVMSEPITTGTLLVESATKLLQDAIAGDIPIEQPAAPITTSIAILEILFGNLATENDD